MITRDRVVALLFLAFSVAYGLMAQDIELYFGDEEAIFTARTFPTFLAIVGSLFALLMLLLPAQGKPSLDAETVKGILGGNLLEYFNRVWK